jgi:hypothetical protein
MATVRRSFRLDQRAVDKMLSGRGGEVSHMLAGFASLTTQEVRATAKERVKTHTGRYLRSIHSTLRDPTRLRVEARAPYAMVLERGSRPHVIRARRASVLAFYWDRGPRGPGMYFYPRVHHPGTRPYNILRDGVRRAGRRLNRLARK